MKNTEIQDKKNNKIIYYEDIVLNVKNKNMDTNFEIIYKFSTIIIFIEFIINFKNIETLINNNLETIIIFFALNFSLYISYFILKNIKKSITDLFIILIIFNFIIFQNIFYNLNTNIAFKYFIFSTIYILSIKIYNFKKIIVFVIINLLNYIVTRNIFSKFI